MKKTLAGVFILSVALFSLSFKQPVSAACGSSFFIGANAENVSGCTGLSEGQHIDGFSIDIENNKITLNNYNGGAIHYFCRGTCTDVKTMEIELIGDNTIDSQSSNAYLNESDVPQDAAFINIVPTFTGNGTLKIEAGQPVAFNGNSNSNTFSIDIIGADFERSTVESSTQGGESVAPITNTIGESKDKNQTSPESFFETTLGVALLITVPSVLVIIIIILLVALLNKNKKNPLIVTENKPNNNQ